MDMRDLLRWRSAVHEAGHAVIGLALGVPGVAEIHHGGGVVHHEGLIGDGMVSPMHDAAILHAGSCAEMIIGQLPVSVQQYGRIIDADSDEVKLLGIAARFGGNSPLAFDRKARRLATRLIALHWRDVLETARTLFMFGRAEVGVQPSIADAINAQMTASLRASLSAAAWRT